MATSSRYNASLRKEWESIVSKINKFSEVGNHVMVDVLRRRHAELARIFDQPRRKRMRVASSSTSGDSSSSE
jgi:hypothetical protein